MVQDSLHYGDFHGDGVLSMAGRANIRQIRRGVGGSKGVFYRIEKRIMKMHHIMWILMAMAFLMFGMLYRGQQDMLMQQMRAQGASMVLIDMSLKSLGEVNI